MHINNHNLLKAFELIAQNLFDAEEVKGVAPYIAPKDLHEKIDLALIAQGVSEEALIAILNSIVLNTPRTNTKAFFNQLFGGRNNAAVLGDLLSVILNNSMYTYKVAGVQVGIEKEVINKVNTIIGWDKNADGTFAPGGSMANYMGMLMARDALFPEIRSNGMQKTLRVYTSSESHYSTLKNAAFAGIGRENVVAIPVDNNGAMISDLLEKEIVKDQQNGHFPFFINATLGTTVLGAFDILNDLAEISNKYNLWLHADGAYCGGVLFSNKYKHLIAGVEKTNSFCFNAHKMLGTPLSCSLIVTKEKRHLLQSFSNEAEYLYQTDDDEYNLGKTSLQCGRRNDALKFWALWKSIGTKGLEKMVDHQFALADYAMKYLKSNPNYTIYGIEQSISVCFNYKNYCPKKLCTLLYEQEKLMIGYGEFQNQAFIRLVTVNANNREKEIEAFFSVLENFADQNAALLNANNERNTRAEG